MRRYLDASGDVVATEVLDGDVVEILSAETDPAVIVLRGATCAGVVANAAARGPRRGVHQHRHHRLVRAHREPPTALR